MKLLLPNIPPENILFQLLEMIVHQFFGAFAIVRHNRLDDLAVFVRAVDHILGRDALI
jgi:hypothetical protein